MHFLILGGTVFLGRHVVDAALARGHALTLLNRGRHGAGLFPHVIGEKLIGFIEVNAKFLKGVYPGDTLYPALEIVELKPQKTTGLVVMRATVHNQKRELVLDGQHKYLLKLN